MNRKKLVNANKKKRHQLQNKQQELIVAASSHKWEGIIKATQLGTR